MAGQAAMRLLAVLAVIGSAAPSGFAWAANSADTSKSQAKVARPNIVFLLFDDIGFSDFGAYGSEIATPNIDALARSGVRFSNFHTASTCEATRVMLQSGVDNHRAGAGTLGVVIADNQKGKPGYEGYLSDEVHSLGQLMRDGGYATYYAGKWNIGKGVERSPGTRGWDRYVALEQTGADNFEAKVYAPFDLEAVWWEDGRLAELPKDFFSTQHYFDKAIQYIDEGRGRGKPFMAMIALQAVHSPLQAPQADIDQQRGRYELGWEKVREARYRRQVVMGLMPDGLQLPRAPYTREWASLTVEERRDAAKRMAVYAAMLSNADAQLGRFTDYLKKIGEFDNTVFIVMSDNGADPYDLARVNLPFRLWYAINRSLGHERMGNRGSYVHYGVNWAEVSNTPFALFKGTANEGGLRVPLIVSWPARIRGDRISDQFSYATDFLPTVLDLAGIPLPGDDYQGRKLHRPTGVSLLPVLEGTASSVHGPDHVTGFESTGGFAIFRGDYKLVKDSAGEGSWRLFDLRRDPTESRDLAALEPAIHKALLAEVEKYKLANGVVMPEPGYDGLRQLLKNNWLILLRQLWPLLVAGLLALLLLSFAVLRLFRRLMRVRST